MYSLMNYADLCLGTWYPEGGMHKIVEGMVSLAEELGVKFKLGEEVKQISIPNGSAKQVVTSKGTYDVDAIVGAADYHHIEREILEARF
ncbi:MAG: FAD-dependent oxidoreductase [Saprospiraceae bacterium]